MNRNNVKSELFLYQIEKENSKEILNKCYNVKILKTVN